MIINIAIDGPAGAGKSTIAKMIAKEKLPSSGMLRYHSILVGKSHRKSDNGPIKLNTPLIASKIACMIFISFLKFTYFSHYNTKFFLCISQIFIYR